MSSTSVALCTYNGEKHVRQQLESIAAQTRLPDEVVVCDDLSTDGTVAIVEAVARTAPFALTLHENATRLGTIKNFEAAIGRCSGDIVLLADQDDWWEPGKIATLASALGEDPAAGFAFSDALVVGSALEPLGRTLWQTIGFTGARRRCFDEGPQLRTLLTGGEVVYGNTLAFKRDVLRRVIPIDLDPWCPYMTHDTWIALVLSATGSRGIAVDRPLIRYRQHREQQAGVSGAGTFVDAVRRSPGPRQAALVGRAEALAAVARRAEASVGPSEPLRELHEVVAHLRARARARASSPGRRARLIWDELRSGRYARFSSAWRSAVRDAVDW